MNDQVSTDQSEIIDPNLEKIAEQNKLIAAQQNKIEKLTERGIAVKDENALLVDDAIGKKMAEMKYQLQLADHFVKSNALPKGLNAEQCFMIIRAGADIGMTETQAIRGLYIVNGSIQPYGQGMSAVLLKNGYKIDFHSEDMNGVTVVIEKGEEIYEYVVEKSKEAILSNSKAMAFAPKDKMRWHGIRQIIKYHLAHLFAGVELNDVDDYPTIDVMVKENKFNKVEEKKELMGKNEVKEETPSEVPNIFNNNSPTNEKE